GRGRRHQRRAAGTGHLTAGCFAAAGAARGRRWPVSTNSSAAVPGGVAARDRGQKARRPGTPRVRTDGVSAEARRQAAAIPEVLAGVRTPSEVAAQLAISLTRYYIIESRALQGLLAACEPRPRGKVRSPASELAALRRECEQLRRQAARQQALLRVTERTVGL